MDDRLLPAARVDEDAQCEAGLRPRLLDEYIGQDRIRENLQAAISAAKQRREPLDHVLLHGPPGLGKTTLAYVIANEMGVPVRATSGPAIEKPGDLVGIVTNLKKNEVLFIDEIHRMSPAIEEILYPALEDYEVDIVIGQGPSARTQKVPVKPFTLIGATTRTGLLTAPLRSRFGITHRLEFFTPADLEEILRRAAKNNSGPHDASRGERPPVGKNHRRADRRRGGRRNLQAVARHAAHRQPPAAPRPRLRAGAARGPNPAPRCALRAEAARSRRALIRRSRSQAAADDHRQVRRRPGRLEHDCGGDNGGEGRDRGHLRAVPDSDRLPRSHAARPGRNGGCLRLLRVGGAGRTT